MENAENIFKKEKVISFMAFLSMVILCIQHFWGIFAEEEIQVAYVPLIITLATIAINEVAGSYEKRKKIVVVSLIGAGIIAIIGLSLMAVNEYGISFDPGVWLNKAIYVFMAVITFVLAIFELEKTVKI